MEKKVFIADIKSINEGEKSLVATISTDAIDRMDEVLSPEGINLKDYRKNPVVLWAHDYSTPPIGKAVWVKKDESGKGVISKVIFASTEFAQEIFQLYKEGFMKAFSVGFLPTEWMDGKKQGDPRRTYTKWDLLEFSAVPVPANPEALALAMSKGIKQDVIDKAFTKEQITQITEFNNEETQTSSQAKAIEPIVVNPALDELLAENKLLEEKLKALEIENSYLRFDKYKLLEGLNKKNSEITVEMLESKTLGILDGVIRKHTGKIN